MHRPGLSLAMQIPVLRQIRHDPRTIALIIVALLFGHEIKGSRRWIFGIQPSEFLKDLLSFNHSGLRFLALFFR